MKAEVEIIDSVRKKVRITIPEEQVKKKFDIVYRDIAKKIQIKGFRPGKVPRHILSAYYKNQVKQEVMVKLIEDSLPLITKEKGITIVSNPSIENEPLEEGKEFTYTASFEVKPDITVKEYLGIEVQIDKAEVTPQMLEERLKEIQESHATLKTIEDEEEAKEGVFALIDFQAFIGEKPLEGGKVLGHLLELKPNYFIPGFCENVIGMKKGEERDFILDIPSDYDNKEFAGKKVTFQVKLHDLKKKILPSLDDDFAKALGEFKDLEDLKNKIRVKLEEEERERMKNQIHQNLISALIASNPFELPPSLVNQEIEYMLAETLRNLSIQGLNLEKLGTSLNELREKYRDAAERKIRTSLILESIAKQEGIEVNDAELEEELKNIAEKINQEIEKIKAYYAKENRLNLLKMQILEEKALAFLTEKAKIKYRN